MLRHCNRHRRTGIQGRTRRAGAGFTIVELMLALVIIGIMAMAIAPSLSSVMADRRQSAGPYRLINAARVAQARTKETGVAHLLRIAAASDPSLGSFAVWMGMTSSCSITPWADADDFDPVLEVDMAEYNPIGDGATAPTLGDPGRHVIALGAAQGGSAPDWVEVCYEPSGRVFTADSGNASLVPQALDYEFNFTRTVDGVAKGVRRQVFFPPGGSPRIR